MKKTIISLILTAVLLLSFTACGEESHDMNIKYFGRITYAETKKECSTEDKKEVEPVLGKIEEAFRYIDKNGDSEEKFGALSSYCLSKEYFPDMVKENHEVTFVTAKLKGSSGYIWIKYNQEGIDENGKAITGSWDILSRIKLKKVNGEWNAVSVKEAP